MRYRRGFAPSFTHRFTYLHSSVSGEGPLLARAPFEKPAVSANRTRSQPTYMLTVSMRSVIKSLGSVSGENPTGIMLECQYYTRMQRSETILSRIDHVQIEQGNFCPICEPGSASAANPTCDATVGSIQKVKIESLTRLYRFPLIHFSQGAAQSHAP